MKLVEEGYSVGAGLNRGRVEFHEPKMASDFRWNRRRAPWFKKCIITGKNIAPFGFAYIKEVKTRVGYQTESKWFNVDQEWMSEEAYMFQKLKGEV